MQSRFFKDHIALFCLAALAICLIVARACLQSVTIDEANSCLAFARNSWPAQWYPALDNHVLNTLLERFITSIFGLNELTMRMPAIIGAVIYIGSALYFCALLTARTILQVPLFLCLVFNPMVLDYLVAARGYSLAVGFLLAAIAVIANVMLADDNGEQAGLHGKCALASILLGLSFVANFSFVFVDATTMLLFFLWAARHRYFRLAVPCFLPGIVVALVLCGPILAHYPKLPLKDMSHSLAEMWTSMIWASFDDLNPEVLNPLLISWLGSIRPVLPYLGVFAMVVLLTTAEIVGRRSKLVMLARLLAGTAAIVLVLHWFGFHALQIPLPRARTALFFVLLWTLVFGCVVAVLFQSGKTGVIGWCGIGVLMLVAAYFVGCLRLGYFKEWRFNADTKQVYWVITDLRRRCGVTDFGTDWRYSSVLNFYRTAYGNHLLPEFTTSGSGELPTDRGTYVIFYPTSEEFIKQQRLEVIYHNEQSGAAIAIRGCATDARPN